MATDQALRALSDTCPTARMAVPEDAVTGVLPRYAASPASVSEASALLRAAAAYGLTVVARGAGTKLDWGAAPSRCDLVIDTLLLDQVIEHAAGDLVATVQAGVRAGPFGEVLAKAGQQLALDAPPVVPGGKATGGREGGTIGGILATAAAGPRRLRYGTPRDLVIGIRVVRPDGTVARSGGKVVKNVAGYDLGKLFAGSYGTLGLIVEAVFRLHPLPAGTAYVSADCTDPGTAHAAVARVVASELAPSAVEIDRPARGCPVRVGVLLEGDPAGVSERAELMRGILANGAVASQAAPAWWGWPGIDGGPAAAGGPPGASTRQPTTEASQPVTDASQPGGGAGQPGTDTGHPGGRGIGRPGTDTSHSGDGDTGQPGGGTGQPGGRGIGRPGTGTGHPGAGTGQPGGGGAGQPGTGTGQPGGGGAGQPGTGTGQPGGGDTGHPGGGGAGTLIRVAFWAAALPRVLGVIDAAAAEAGLDPAVGGSAAAGVIYAGFGLAAAPSAIGAFVSAVRAALARGNGGLRPASVPPSGGPPALASAVVVHAPPAVRDVVDVWGPMPSQRLMRAVKDQFDPEHRMAPGRFAGGF